MKPPVRHCAIYTRKSSEEGLEQDFNSLDAQREACLSYISSQKGEGWIPVAKNYDDGGFSGGNMQRPALQELLNDIQAGKVHIIVVYKIDRLTRSLMDFAKLVEIFDQHQVTFVSVTQSFNTTTSMGRLTLNVLLSFAQFEREVTGERIRDKVAASKKKGMWMGGYAPIGYDCADHKLVVNEREAAKVRYIFEKYLEFGCISKLKAHLDKTGYKSAHRTSKAGRVSGGKSFSRGILYNILKNPAYIGRIQHKDKLYDGQHEAIVSEAVWDQVQSLLKNQAARTRVPQNGSVDGDLLKGLLYDSEGNRYSPCYSMKKGRQYRYYVSQNLLQYRDHPKGIMARLPAQEIENAVTKAVAERFKSIESLASVLTVNAEENRRSLEYIVAQNIPPLPVQDILEKIIVNADTLNIRIKTAALHDFIKERFEIDVGSPESSKIDIIIPYKIRRSRNGAVIIEPANTDQSDPFDMPASELKSWIQGIVWREEHFNGMTLQAIADREGFSATHILKYIKQSFRTI